MTKMNKRPEEMRPTKTSFYLPKMYIDAMNVIKDNKKVLFSHQVELALKEYFRQHAEILINNDIDVWKDE